MTTATATTKTALCSVTFNDESIVVKSPSGKEVTLCIDGVPQRWDLFSATEQVLLERIAPCGGTSPHKIEMTFDEMRTFASYADRAAQAARAALEAENHQPKILSVLTPPSQPVVIDSGEECTLDRRKPVVRADQSLADKTVKHETGKVTKNIVTTGDQANDAEARVNGLKAVVETVSTEDYYLFWYYINSLSDLQNPSFLLWNVGFRFDGSCWIIPGSKINSANVKRITRVWDTAKSNVLANGKQEVDYCIVRQPEEYREMYRSRAQNALDMEIRRIHTSLIECIDAASKRLQDALTAERENPLTATEQDKLDQVRDNSVRSRIVKAQEELSACIQCAEAFDMTEQFSDLISGLRAAIRSQTESFNALVSVKGRKLAPTI